jgi:hypothetical protein
MPLPIQLPDGSVVLSNRFGHGPFDDCQPFVRIVLPPGVRLWSGSRRVFPGFRRAAIAQPYRKNMVAKDSHC